MTGASVRCAWRVCVEVDLKGTQNVVLKETATEIEVPAQLEDGRIWWILDNLPE